MPLHAGASAVMARESAGGARARAPTAEEIFARLEPEALPESDIMEAFARAEAAARRRDEEDHSISRQQQQQQGQGQQAEAARSDAAVASHTGGARPG